MPDRSEDYVAGSNARCPPGRMVVVSGCSGGGKSTLLAEMARRGYAAMPEPGRQIVREETLLGGSGLPWQDMGRFLDLCVSRAAHFYNNARPQRGFVLFDRSAVDAVAAARRLRLPMPDAFFRAATAYRYAPTVFMLPPWPQLHDGDPERQLSFDQAVAEYEDLMQAYPALGYEVVTVPRMGVDERADFLEAQLAALAA